jgi:RNA polymerase sigma-70 factor (ECF subfamily)
MRGADTNLGGVNRGFPETTAGITLHLCDPGSPGYRTSLTTLCQRYWKPVYGYIRAAWAKSNEDAKDLTQAFFLWLVEEEVLERFDPARGSFRGYLKVLLRRFVGHEEAALHRLKRGGGVRILPLDEAAGSLDSGLADPASGDPEKIFEKAWVAEILNAALGRVRERSEAGPQKVRFQVYEAYDLASPSERPTYRELANRMGLREQEVKDHLFAVREEVRQEVLAELSRGTGNDRQLKEDWDALFGS